MTDRTPFPRWAYAAALKEVAKAPTLEALDSVALRAVLLVEDQGKLELAAAVRRRRLELALAGGEAVAIGEHHRAVERARIEERRLLLEELEAIAVELVEEARRARRQNHPLLAAAKTDHAELIRKAARRCAGLGRR